METILASANPGLPGNWLLKQR